jgi:hypothetical protein
MTAKSIAVALALACGLTVPSAQTPATIDTSRVGPQVGQRVPPLDGVDQFGKRHTLSSLAGPRGTMLVFFRSADW